MELGQLGLLEVDIRKRFRQNRDEKYFVPYEWLVDLLEDDRIRKVLDETKEIKAWDLTSVVSEVRGTALRVFGILVLMKHPELIFNFVQRGSTDGRLPMSKQVVLEVLAEPDLIQRRKQLVKDLKSQKSNAKSDSDEATSDNDELIDNDTLKNNDTLRGIEAQLAPIKGLAKEFEKTQWIFLGLEFPQPPPHKLLFGERPLPFLAPQTGKGRSGGGRFGAIFEEKLPLPTFNDDAHKVTILNLQ
jgi:hypothetical protein